MLQDVEQMMYKQARAITINVSANNQILLKRDSSSQANTMFAEYNKRGHFNYNAVEWFTCLVCRSASSYLKNN